MRFFPNEESKQGKMKTINEADACIPGCVYTSSIYHVCLAFIVQWVFYRATGRNAVINAGKWIALKYDYIIPSSEHTFNMIKLYVDSTNDLLIR